MHPAEFSTFRTSPIEHSANKPQEMSSLPAENIERETMPERRKKKLIDGVNVNGRLGTIIDNDRPRSGILKQPRGGGWPIFFGD